MTKHDPARTAQPKRVKARTAGVRGYKLVTRATKYGNPFSIAEHGRLGCLLLYRTWITESDDGQRVATLAKTELRGRDLGCSCPLDQPCHADILLQIANEEPNHDHHHPTEKESNK